MKKILATTVLLLFAGMFSLNAQKTKFQFLAFYNTQPDLPFGKFGALFIKDLHPGIEYGKGKIIRGAKKHDWIWSNRAGYFYHRFVQHAVYINTDGRYRWKKGSLGIEASIGTGVLASLPATGVFRLTQDGEYKSKSPDIRLQASANIGAGISWALQSKTKLAGRIFLRYEQKLQFPFIRSYVPFLPYNSMMAGYEFPISLKSKTK